MFHRAAIVGILLLNTVAIAVAGVHAPIPETLSRSGAATPFFVSARSIERPGGGLNLTAFSDPVMRQAIEIEFERRKSGAIADCTTSTMSAASSGSFVRSVNELGATSQAIYLGRVVAAIPGFALSAPATMLAVEITEPRRTTSAFPTAGRIYVLYPAADFTIDGTRFCSASVHGAVPVAGDEIALFASEAPVDADGIVIPIGVNQIAFTSGTTLRVSPALRPDPVVIAAKSLHEIVAHAAKTPRSEKGKVER